MADVTDPAHPDNMTRQEWLDRMAELRDAVGDDGLHIPEEDANG